MMRFAVLSDHYCQREMPMDNHDSKAWSTKATNYGYLRKWIIPRWGECAIAEITPVAVEDWLKTLQPLAAGSRAKIRNLMSTIYRHAMRHGFIANNPIQLVRQCSKRRREPEILDLEEIKLLLGGLRLRERAMVLLDMGSGVTTRRIVWLDVARR
jgi:site-specific recombinase XerD